MTLRILIVSLALCTAGTAFAQCGGTGGGGFGGRGAIVPAFRSYASAPRMVYRVANNSVVCVPGQAYSEAPAVAAPAPAQNSSFLQPEYSDATYGIWRRAAGRSLVKLLDDQQRTIGAAAVLDNGMILTAADLVDSQAGPRPTRFVTLDGEQTPLEPIVIDRNNNAAVLRTQGARNQDGTAPNAPPAAGVASRGSQYQMPPSGPFAAYGVSRDGQYQAATLDASLRREGESWISPAPMPAGMLRGGPMFCSMGQIAGIVTQLDAGQTRVVPSTYLRQLSHLAERRVEQWSRVAAPMARDRVAVLSH